MLEADNSIREAFQLFANFTETVFSFVHLKKESGSDTMLLQLSKLAVSTLSDFCN
jgi:hypothetical protein